jgi:hypothetical protein
VLALVPILPPCVGIEMFVGINVFSGETTWIWGHKSEILIGNIESGQIVEINTNC